MKVQSQRMISRPRAEVFRVFTDLEAAPRRIEGIQSLEVLTEGPMTVGTRFRETRKMFGKEATEEMTVTEFRPNEGYVTTAESCGAKYRSEYTFKEAPEGTQVDFTFEGKPMTLIAKVMTPVMGLLLGRMMRRCLEADLNDLTRALEAGEIETGESAPE